MKMTLGFKKYFQLYQRFFFVLNNDGIGHFTKTTLEEISKRQHKCIRSIGESIESLDLGYWRRDSAKYALLNQRLICQQR